MINAWLTYIVGGKKPIGAGKTSLMYHLVRPYMMPPLVDEKLTEIRKYIENMQRNGWNNVSFSEHMECPVYVVGDVFISNDSGYAPRRTMELEFDQIRLPGGKKKAARPLPHSIICIPDLANYVDSRESMSSDGPDKYQCMFLALRRKIGLRFIVDGQYYDGSDKRWRQMADCIIEILEFKHTPGDYYKPAVTEWKCLKFPGYQVYEKYMKTQDENLAEEVTFAHVGDLFGYGPKNEKACIDSLTGRERFFDGTDWNFSARVAEPTSDKKDAMLAKCARFPLSKQKEGA